MKKNKIQNSLKVIKYLADVEEKQTQLMIQSSIAIHRENAIKSNFMYWADAKDEQPADKIEVYLKITFQKRTIMTVGFYSTEMKRFLTKSGDWYMKRNVKWLKNDKY